MKAYFLPLLILAFALTGSRCLAQSEVDAVILKNGSKILGTIIEQVPNKSLKIRTRDGSEYVYSFDDIEIIRKEAVWVDDQITDLREAAYYELGANFGTPAGFNIAFGRWFGTLGLRLSGALYGDALAGAQLNIGFKLSDNSNRSHVLALIAGSSRLEKDDGWFTRNKYWTYLGAVYELNLGGFFLQAGASVGEGDYSNPQLMFQIGYMHRFLGD
ncbi:MAG: hypothetical protein M5R41_16905 [Bacteroidia bacterium]|nr:hypothetical protein [Bacteroidia bacterium]